MRALLAPPRARASLGAGELVVDGCTADEQLSHLPIDGCQLALQVGEGLACHGLANAFSRSVGA